MHLIHLGYTFSTDEYHARCDCGWIRYGRDVIALGALSILHTSEAHHAPTLANPPHMDRLDHNPSRDSDGPSDDPFLAFLKTRGAR